MGVTKISETSEHLKPEELAKIVELEARIADVGVPRHTLLRFLRARRWDVSAALEQYLATEGWRAEHSVGRYIKNAPGPFFDSDLGSEFQQNLSKLSCGGVECFPQMRLVEPSPHDGSWFFFGQALYFGFDKEGRPIQLQRVGVASTRFSEMYSFAGEDARRKIIDSYIRSQELQTARMEESSARLGRRVTQQVVIMDLKGLSFWPDARAMSIFKEFLMISQRYYPETLALHFFINTPSCFMAIWRVIRDCLDPVTTEKMHLLGSDFKCTLLRYIPADQLPEEYGGTNPFDALRQPRSQSECERLISDYTLAANVLPGATSFRRDQDKEFSPIKSTAVKATQSLCSTILALIGLFLAVLAVAQ